MNNSHFPSLELCKKLTEIGFPETEIAWCNMAFRKSDKPDIRVYNGDIGTPRLKEDTVAVCPDVMEMLDVIPNQLWIKGELCDFLMTRGTVCYENSGYTRVVYFHEIVPNALAEIILWLHEKKYISFNK